MLTAVIKKIDAGGGGGEMGLLGYNATEVSKGRSPTGRWKNRRLIGGEKVNKPIRYRNGSYKMGGRRGHLTVEDLH